MGTQPENRRAIFGGGRYDKLVESFGGESISAIGFGMGDVSLRDMLEIRGLLPTKGPQADIGICIIGDESVTFANQLASTLRNSDLNVLVDYSFSRVTNQIEKMNKRKFPFIICVGEEEVKKSKFILKNLKTGKEKKFKTKDIIKFVKKELSR